MGDYNDKEFVDSAAEYSPKSEFSKPALAYMAFEKCIAARAKEMKKGYYNTTVSKDGLPLKTWIEDSRKVYCSSVEALRLTLWPELLIDTLYTLDDEPTDKEGSKTKKDKTTYEKYCYSIYEATKGADGKTVFKRTEETYMPEIDSLVEVRHIMPDGSEKLVLTASHWNAKVNVYWDTMVTEYDIIYKELMRVIHRLNYFKKTLRMG